MVNHSMSVQVPDSLYARLKERAAQAHHTVEDEVLSVLAAAVPRDDALRSPKNAVPVVGLKVPRHVVQR